MPTDIFRKRRESKNRVVLGQVETEKGHYQTEQGSGRPSQCWTDGGDTQLDREEQETGCR